MKLIVNTHNIIIDKTPINEKEINITEIEFEFASEITNEYVKEAYFTKDNKSYKQIITNNKCSIPYEVLEEKGQIEIGVVAYLVENKEEIKRYNPSPVYITTLKGSLKDAENSEPITPSELEQYEQALEDGLQEVSNVNIDAEQLENGAIITIIDRTGTSKSVEVLNGKDGLNGQNGRDGIDGKDGKDGINGTNGKDGVDGKDGKDGENGKDGKDGLNGKDGIDGTNGQDGFSPIVQTSKSNKTTTITITDAVGQHTATILDGNDGQDGQDYVLTNQDKIDIANIVLSQLPNADEVEY